MSDPRQSTSMTMVFVRLFWMAFGPGVLGLLLIQIARKGSGWFTAIDAWYWALIVALIVARWAEFRSGTARNTMGEPAQPGELRKYIQDVCLIGFGSWIIANVAGGFHLF